MVVTAPPQPALSRARRGSLPSQAEARQARVPLRHQPRVGGARGTGEQLEVTVGLNEPCDSVVHSDPSELESPEAVADAECGVSSRQ